MIGPEDIEAFAGDIEVADRVVERVAQGVPSGREMHAAEVASVLRALVLWKSAAFAAHDALYAKGIEAMKMQGEGK